MHAVLSFFRVVVCRVTGAEMIIIIIIKENERLLVIDETC